MKNLLSFALVFTTLLFLPGEVSAMRKRKKSASVRMEKRETLRRPALYNNPDQITFELWNKTSKPVIFSLIHEHDLLIRESRQELPRITVPSAEAYSEEGYDLNDNTYIYFYKLEDSVSPFKAYRIWAGKPIYVRVKEQKGKFIFGPQTGRFRGIARSTDSGLKRKNNVTKKDILEVELQS